MLYLSAFTIALVMAIVLIPPLTQIAERLKLVDMPGSRKVHKASIPRVGGIGMILSIPIPLLLWVDLDQTAIALLAGILVLSVFGIWDDRGDLDYRIKFVGQIVAASILVVYGDVTIKVIPFMGLDPVSPLLYYPLSIFVIVAVTNAINLADGLDGLAAGVMLLSLFGVAMLALLAEGTNLMLIALAVIGSIAGFLRFNTFPARIFMGDTGSQFLGFSACALMIMLTQQVNSALNPAIPLLLLGVPVFDTMFVMTRRIYHGVSPFSPDKNHVHHQLLALNYDHYEAVVIIYFAQAIFVFSGILLRYQSDLVVVGSWIVANLLLTTVLFLAGKLSWHAHAGNRKSVLAGFSESGYGQHLYIVSLYVLSTGVCLLLFLGPVFADPIEPETGIAAVILGLLLGLRLVFGSRLWFIYLRLILYIAIAFVVYLVDQWLASMDTSMLVYEYVYIGIIAAALVTSALYRTGDSFKTTPTDYLIVLLMLGAVLISHVYGEGDGEGMAVPIAVKLIIMFYSIEVLLQHMQGRWAMLPLAALWAFAIISAKGLALV